MHVIIRYHQQVNNGLSHPLLGSNLNNNASRQMLHFATMIRHYHHYYRISNLLQPQVSLVVRRQTSLGNYFIFTKNEYVRNDVNSSNSCVVANPVHVSPQSQLYIQNSIIRRETNAGDSRAHIIGMALPQLLVCSHALYVSSGLPPKLSASMVLYVYTSIITLACFNAGMHRMQIILNSKTTTTVSLILNDGWLNGRLIYSGNHGAILI